MEELEKEDQNETKPIEVRKREKPKKAVISKRFIVYLLIFILIVGVMFAVAWGVYLWRDKIANDVENIKNETISSLEKRISSLEKQLVDAKASNKNKSSSNNTSQTGCEDTQPSEDAVGNIKDSITSGNTVVLGSYMASSVNVILAATEGIGEQTPSQAVSDITNFIADATSPWNFSLPASILSSYGKGSYGQYFESISVVGRSNDGKVISFLFDCNGKIDEVFMVGNEELLE